MNGTDTRIVALMGLAEVVARSVARKLCPGEEEELTAQAYQVLVEANDQLPESRDEVKRLIIKHLRKYAVKLKQVVDVPEWAHYAARNPNAKETESVKDARRLLHRKTAHSSPTEDDPGIDLADRQPSLPQRRGVADLRHRIKDLPELDRNILSKFIGLDGPSHTHKELAEQFGITAGHVGLIIKRAMEGCRRTKPCRQCGKDFAYLSPCRRYCSSKCKEDAHKLYAVGLQPGDAFIKRKNCIKCGASFKVMKRKHRKLCRNCQRLGKPYTCIQCGKVRNSTKWRTRKYCSFLCSVEAKTGEWLVHDPNGVCKGCGKEYRRTKSNPVYCSIPCFKKSRKNIRICKRCGKEHQNRNTKVYCSSECYHAYRDENRKAKSRSPRRIIGIKVCKGCQKEYQANDRNPVYCSKDCCSRHRRQDKICLHCGGPRRTNGSKRKYCSPECYRAHKKKLKEPHHAKPLHLVVVPGGLPVPGNGGADVVAGAEELVG